MPSIPRNWFNIPDEAVAVGGLPAAATIERLRNNVIAMGQAASGAPIVEAGWHPYNSSVIGESEGLIYNHAVDGNVTSIETPVLSTDYQYQIVWEALSRNANPQVSLLLDLFLEEIDAYTTGYSLGNISENFGAPQYSYGRVELNPQKHPLQAHIFKVDRLLTAHGNSAPTDGADFSGAAKFTRTNATRITRMRLRAGATNGIRFGRAYLYRRKWEGR